MAVTKDSVERGVRLPATRRLGLVGLVVAMALLVACGGGTNHNASSPSTSQPSNGSSGPTGSYQCSGGNGPSGTNVLSLDMTENTTSQIAVDAKFDGPIPPTNPNPVAGDLRVSLTWYFYTSPADHAPYRVLLSRSFNIVAGRVGAGPIDSSGFAQQISGSTWTLQFNPAVFTQLPAGQRLAFGASVLVEQFVANGSSLGYSQLGAEQTCPQA